jgi:hypothetical protein
MLRTYIRPHLEEGALLTRYGHDTESLSKAKARIERLSRSTTLDEAEIRAVMKNGSERLLAVLSNGLVITIWPEQ